MWVSRCRNRSSGVPEKPFFLYCTNPSHEPPEAKEVRLPRSKRGCSGLICFEEVTKWSISPTTVRDIEQRRNKLITVSSCSSYHASFTGRRPLLQSRRDDIPVVSNKLGLFLCSELFSFRWSLKGEMLLLSRGVWLIRLAYQSWSHLVGPGQDQKRRSHELAVIMAA